MQNDDTVDNMTFEEYKKLNNEVIELYNIMMAMHAEKRRDFVYANARATYMEKKNLLQQASERHPDYADRLNDE